MEETASRAPGPAGSRPEDLGRFGRPARFLRSLAVLAFVPYGGCCQIAPWFLYVQTESKAVTADDVGLFVHPRQTRRPHDELEQAIAGMRDRILDQRVLVLYVHGRGNHPDAAYNRLDLSGLETRYGGPVLMFHWPSWDGAFSIPVVQARKSGRYLREFLAQVGACRTTLPGVRITMVVHSMGNRVLEAAMGSTDPPLVEGAVDNLVLCAADVDVDGHAVWLTRCRFARDVYVLMNPHDTLLCITESETGRRRLGQGLSTSSAVSMPAKRASNVRYVILDDCDGGHDYFVNCSARVRGLLRKIATDGQMDRSLVQEIEPRVFQFR